MKTREGTWRSAVNGRKILAMAVIPLLCALFTTRGLVEEALAVDYELQAESECYKHLDQPDVKHHRSGSSNESSGGGEDCNADVMVIFLCDLAGGTWDTTTCGCDVSDSSGPSNDSSSGSSGGGEDCNADVMVIFSCDLIGGTWDTTTCGCDVGGTGDSSSGSSGGGEDRNADVMVIFLCDLAGGIWNTTTCGCDIGVSGDTRAPTVSVISPSNNSVLSGQVTMTANAGDNVGVAGARFQVDGRNIGEEDHDSPYSVVLDTTTLSNGTHIITVAVRDAAGNTTTSAGVTVGVNNGVDSPDPDQVFPAETYPFSRVHSVPANGMITLNPTLNFSTGLQGVYNCYAACSIDGDIYFAEENFNGEIVFQKLQEGGVVKSFEKRVFSGETSWTCDVFSDLGPTNTSVIRDHEVFFLIAAAPENFGPPEGALFTFSDENGCSVPAGHPGLLRGVRPLR